MYVYVYVYVYVYMYMYMYMYILMHLCMQAYISNFKLTQDNEFFLFLCVLDKLGAHETDRRADKTPSLHEKAVAFEVLQTVVKQSTRTST